MSNTSRISLVLLCVLIAAGLGCRGKQPGAAPGSKSSDGTQTTEGPVLAPPQQQSAPAAPQGADHAAVPTEGGDEKEVAAKIKASLASLTAEDRAIAEKQKICPVSGELLGAMGAPKKINVAGHEVFICCKSCEEPLTEEPAKYLAKIGLEPAK